jgi:hypothetical protein
MPPSVLNSGPEPMATKKSTPNKSDFIRSLPAAMSTGDVIAKGKAEGMKISSSLVYMVRGRAKPKGVVKKKSAPARKAPVVAKNGVASRARLANKAEFVRSRAHLSPREIVEDAKAAGLRLDVGYVYNVRGAAKARSTTKVTTQAARTARAAAAIPRPITTSSKAEDLLKAVAAELGLARAMEILVVERARVRAVIGAA